MCYRQWACTSYSIGHFLPRESSNKTKGFEQVGYVMEGAAMAPSGSVWAPLEYLSKRQAFMQDLPCVQAARVAGDACVYLYIYASHSALLDRGLAGASAFVHPFVLRETTALPSCGTQA